MSIGCEGRTATSRCLGCGEEWMSKQVNGCAVMTNFIITDDGGITTLTCTQAKALVGPQQNARALQYINSRGVTHNNMGGSCGIL